MLRHVVLPLVAAGACAAADAAPISDLRLGAGVGFARRTEITVNDAVSVVDTTPLDVSLDYVRGLGAAPDHGPIVGVRVGYERGGGSRRPAIGADDFHGEALSVDAEAGWAARLPDAPRLRVDATLFLGFRAEHDRADLIFGDDGVGGHGYESGARLALIRTDAAGWQVGAELGYLFASAVTMADAPGGRDVRVTSRGFSAGVVLGHRL